MSIDAKGTEVRETPLNGWNRIDEKKVIDNGKAETMELQFNTCGNYIYLRTIMRGKVVDLVSKLDPNPFIGMPAAVVGSLREELGWDSEKSVQPDAVETASIEQSSI